MGRRHPTLIWQDALFLPEYVKPAPLDLIRIRFEMSFRQAVPFERWYSLITGLYGAQTVGIMNNNYIKSMENNGFFW